MLRAPRAESENRASSASLRSEIQSDVKIRRASRALVPPLREFLNAAAQQHRGRSSGFARRVVNLAKALQDAIWEGIGHAGRPLGSVKRTTRQQGRRICKMARTLRQQDAVLAQRESASQQLQSTVWAVSAGLSDPNTSTRSVETWCREFNHEVAPVSHSYVSHLRNAFAQLLLDMNRRDMKALVASAPGGFVIIKHLHDEATMRLRSTVGSTPTAAPAVVLPTAAPAVRVRSSKIQNAVVSLHVAPDTTSMLPMLVELQPLIRKDACTIASSLRSIAREVCKDAPPELRVLHCIVGDGVATNGAAARMLWHTMTRDGSRSVFVCD